MERGERGGRGRREEGRERGRRVSFLPTHSVTAVHAQTVHKLKPCLVGKGKGKEEERGGQGEKRGRKKSEGEKREGGEKGEKRGGEERKVGGRKEW